jgi:hypothetical protein
MTTYRQKKIQEKREIEIKKAKSELESACEMVGWENDKDMHIFQAKNVIKAYRKIEHLGEESELEICDFEHVMTLIAKSNRLKPYLEKMYDLVETYISKVKEGKLADLDGNRGKNADVTYPEKISFNIYNIMHPDNIPF